ncbi:MAG: NADP oxidoreductase [Bryobacterales bacterium]|nr:NADP oxidoreductase [Bryobacterales bacterium]
MDTVKTRLATVWMGGCSGCHMSFLDLDETLLELAAKVELCYSPIADAKEFPEVDVTLVEGCLANREHLAEIRHIRARTKILIAFGDCAITGNITAIRNSVPLGVVLSTAYGDPRFGQTQGVLPVLLDEAMPLHEAVKVDYYLPGCPPSAEKILDLVGSLLAGEPVNGSKRFG